MNCPGSWGGGDESPVPRLVDKSAFCLQYGGCFDHELRIGRPVLDEKPVRYREDSDKSRRCRHNGGMHRRTGGLLEKRRETAKETRTAGDGERIPEVRCRRGR